MSIDERRRGARLNFHPMGCVPSDEEDADDTPQTTLTSLRHSRFNMHPHKGLPGSRNSYLTGIASPEKVALPSQAPIWNEDPPLPEIDETFYPWLDPAYVHQRDTMDPEPATRRRTESVSLYVSDVHLCSC
jgi:hypothetical protein